MGVPPIVAGLVVTILLWRSGPLGSLELLYTPTAMVIAQTAIALPLVAGLSTAALQHVDPELRLQMQALGASRVRSLWVVAVEARLPLLAAGMAGKSACVPSGWSKDEQPFRQLCWTELADTSATSSTTSSTRTTTPRATRRRTNGRRKPGCDSWRRHTTRASRSITSSVEV